MLLLRSPESQPSPLPFPSSLLVGDGPLLRAAALLASPAPGRAEWNAAPGKQILAHAATVAHLASRLAELTGRADSERAWCAGLLAAAGWFAATAVAPERVQRCLADPAFPREPRQTAVRHLGADPAAVVRRLARAWDLPGWLAGVIGHLDLPPAHARRFDVSLDLCCVVRLAVHRARQLGLDLALSGEDVSGDLAILGLEPAALEALSPGTHGSPPEWVDPAGQPLLLDLLALAAENRRLRKSAQMARIEAELDELHDALREQVRSEGDRQRSAKLTALAEFAAGAGHEINNPLAVISGEAQYILGHQADWLVGDTEGAARRALQAIINQTKRVHSILRDLMLFARPAPARPAWLDLPTLVGEVASGLEELATAKQVRVEIACPDRLAVFADGEQLRTALGCLLRNAIEAVPSEGWTRVAVQGESAEWVEVFVEDSGPGPSAEQRPHLFDPFYSGRNAGRGRGLGLPVAWRLARQQGGDISLEPIRPGQPTRFVLRLPRPEPAREAA